MNDGERETDVRTCAPPDVLQGLLRLLLLLALTRRPTALAAAVAAADGDAGREDEEALDLAHHAAECGVDTGCVFCGYVCVCVFVRYGGRCVGVVWVWAGTHRCWRCGGRRAPR